MGLFLLKSLRNSKHCLEAREGAGGLSKVLARQKEVRMKLCCSFSCVNI